MCVCAIEWATLKQRWARFEWIKQSQFVGSALHHNRNIHTMIHRVAFNQIDRQCCCFLEYLPPLLRITLNLSNRRNTRTHTHRWMSVSFSLCVCLLADVDVAVVVAVVILFFLLFLLNNFYAIFSTSCRCCFGFRCIWPKFSRHVPVLQSLLLLLLLVFFFLL